MLKAKPSFMTLSGTVLALSMLAGCGTSPVAMTPVADPGPLETASGPSEPTTSAAPSEDAVSEAPRAEPEVAPSYGAKAVPGEIVVKLKKAMGIHSVPNMMRIESIEELGNTSVYKVPEGETVEAALAKLRKDPNVVYAEPNYIYRAFGASAKRTVNDPKFGELWGMTKIQAPQAWDVTTGSQDVLVAVVDTGVDYNHPDLQGQVIKGPDFGNNDNDPMDDQGHGTHVAGTIAALGDNGTGVVGVAYNTKIIAIKVLGSDGSGSMAAIAKGILKAQEMGAKVINLSLGGPQASSVLKSAVDKATQQGALVVVASGNENTQTPSYPAAYPNALSVGSTTTSDARSNFSNYGSTVDIAAPGSDILSTTEKTYKKQSGTSMASPHVAAGAAILLGKNPSLTNSQLREILSSTGDSASGFNNSAVKRMNLSKALAAVSSNPGTSPNPGDTEAPSVPSGVKALAASSTQVQLSWNASSDNASVAGYRVYRNGQQIATTSGTTYADSGLAAGTAYAYTVAAYDGAGNVSAQSAPANITTPSAETELTISDVYLKSLSSDAATVAWSTSVASSGQVDYTSNTYYYYGYWWTARHSGMAADHAVVLSGLRPGTIYYLKLSSTDASGKKVTAGLYGIKTLN